jgi:glycosyltransferase involved in cell wall biosynthesis
MHLLTVVITCYNHGAYLDTSIRSVLDQGFDDVELIVVDDGSTDHTPAVAGQWAEATYIRQQNQGLSAARNTGLGAATGRHICFLDADDWFLPGALYAIGRRVQAHPTAALLVGGHIKAYDTPTGVRYGETSIPALQPDPYTALLRCNVIEMHAAVAYRRDVLRAMGGFDEALPAAEDYEVLLRVARDHPTRRLEGYPKPVAAYRRHATNMSDNPGLMLKSTLDVLRRHRSAAADCPAHRQALQEGLRFHKDLYGARVLRRVKRAPRSAAARSRLADDLALLVRYAPVWTVRRLGRHLAEYIRW